MVLIFYDTRNEQYHICPENQKPIIVKSNDPNLMAYIPNDDIAYVQNVHLLTKKQFIEWQKNKTLMLSTPVNPLTADKFRGIMDDTPIYKQTGQVNQNQAPIYMDRKYIHPTANGTVIIEDVKNEKYPHGIILNGKWHFEPIDQIGMDAFESSAHIRILLNKKKIEVVDEEYVQKNKHKSNPTVSPYQAALDAILIPNHMRAAAVADNGGLPTNSSTHPQDGAVEIYIQ